MTREQETDQTPHKHKWIVQGAFGDTGWGHERVAVQCSDCGEIEIWDGEEARDYGGWGDD